HGGEHRRVIGDDELRAGRARFVGDGRGVIDGDEDARDVGRRIADEQADVVPALRVTKRRELLEDGGDVSELGHILKNVLIWLMSRRERSCGGSCIVWRAEVTASSSACRDASSSLIFSTT